MAELTETLPGIWFWEARHPDWDEDASWPPVVRSWALATDAGLLLVDPLVHDDRGDSGDGDAGSGAETWRELDALAADHGGVSAVLRTLHYHHRSAAQASARYDVPIYARPIPRDTVPVHPFDLPVANGGELPGGLIARHLSRDDELAIWIPSAGALLFADVGQRRDGRFELCPDWWLDPPDSWTQLREQVGELAQLAPEHLLVSHGEHKLGDGGELGAAVQRALSRPLPPFISAAELRQRREHWKLVDVRLYLDGRSGREGYEQGHLPGAVYVELAEALSAPVEPDARHGRHPLPEPERFAAGMAAAGISDGDTVIAYDDAGGVIAARLVWMLRALGHDAALLDGGITARLTDSGTDELETGPGPAPKPGSFTAKPWPAELLADIDEVAARPAQTVLVDARDPERYAGGSDPVDPRSGHIPGAVSVPCRANLNPDGTIAAPGVLEQRFRTAGIGRGSAVISSCGSGVTACHNLLALEYAGFGRQRLYPGSWSEWSRDPQRPIETGTRPGPASR